jgi:hypothetical protein
LLCCPDVGILETGPVFVEMRSGDVFGRNGGPRPSQDKDTLDVSHAGSGPCRNMCIGAYGGDGGARDPGSCVDVRLV